MSAKKLVSIQINYTPGPLCNMFHYKMVLDISWLIAGPQMVLLYIYTFYSRYNTDWIANTDIGLDPNNSVIKKLRCASQPLYNTIVGISAYFHDMYLSDFFACTGI